MTRRNAKEVRRRQVVRTSRFSVRVQFRCSHSGFCSGFRSGFDSGFDSEVRGGVTLAERRFVCLRVRTLNREPNPEPRTPN